MNNLTNIDEQIINHLSEKIERDNDYLDFLGSSTKTLTHSYHTYPAMMIPQLAKEFIEMTMHYNPDISTLYDPFMGSGTSIVEGITHNLESYGIDINPLSLMMTQAKTTPIEPNYLNNSILQFMSDLNTMNDLNNRGIYKITNIPNFNNIEFWFKEEVIEKLQLIKNAINEFDDINLINFFKAAFSETVRYVSNTRNNEFKLYRMPPAKLDEWSPNVLEYFLKKVLNNQKGNTLLYKKLQEVQNPKPIVNIQNNSNIRLPNVYKNEMFDIVVTSPPYGDSGTTVAYGQFSRLSLQWLDLKIDEETNINQLDKIMLGGKVDKLNDPNYTLVFLQSPTLNKVYSLIEEKDPKRAKEVLQFYVDLDKSIQETTRVMKKGSYQYWVVANRTVKMINIPTDIIVAELFEKYNVKHLHSFYRKIPNKRMPSKNSPTNKIGNHSVTMTSEIILMLKKL
ncbi:hypothetical protein [Mammaliicoccus sciuri]|uniref:hypothetical protein n=1 Tax=Mammaliicoccus sciuri TaxID=1296 RepID=UPI003F552A00